MSFFAFFNVDAVVLDAFDGDGFELTPRDDDAGSVDFFYVAIETELDLWAGYVESPITEEIISVTAPGFLPVFVLLLVMQPSPSK